MSQTVSFVDPFVVTITIDPGIAGPIVRKDKNLRTGPSCPTVWFIVNNDPNTAYRIVIDYDQIVDQSGGSSHPFAASKLNSTRVGKLKGTQPGTAAIVDVIKDTAAPHTYTYSVDVYLPKSKTLVTSVDPDLEVVDPFPLVFEAR